MANRTVKDAVNVKGTNPQYLVEKIIRSRIYESKYWKEECFALSAELLVDKAISLRSIGGVCGGNVKPTNFLCLILKMLQIQPERDIIIEFIKNEDFKYVRALGAFYLRIVGTSLDCFKYLEPLYLDYRKLRFIDRTGEYQMKHMDEFIDALLHEERVNDIQLPRLQKRQVLEETNQLETRVSALDDDLEEGDESDDADHEMEEESPKKADHDHYHHHHHREERSHRDRIRTHSDLDRDRRRDRHDREIDDRSDRRKEDRDRDRDRNRDRDRMRERDMYRDREKHWERNRDFERRKRDHHSNAVDDRKKHKNKKSRRDDREKAQGQLLKDQFAANA